MIEHDILFIVHRSSRACPSVHFRNHHPSVLWCTISYKLQDCVSVFSENSYRWLIAEQGIMKSGGCNAVRGATAPVAELRYEERGSIELMMLNAVREASSRWSLSFFHVLPLFVICNIVRVRKEPIVLCLAFCAIVGSL